MMKKICFLLSVVLIGTYAFSQNAKVPLKIGDKAPEISLNSPEGVSIPLSSLKGKIVLIYFWGSFVKYSKEENIFALDAYQNFKDKTFKGGKGFAIYAISIDSNPIAWGNAIRKDSLLWPYNVSDLKGWGSEALTIFHVDHCPANYLIDGNAIIIGVDLRGTNLRRKLMELETQ